MNNEELKKDFILLNVGHACHNADWNWQNVNSPFARIHYVKSGTAKIIRDDGVFELKKSHLYLTPSYVKHAYECNGILDLYYIHIYEDSGKKPSIFTLTDFPVEVEATSLDFQLFERLILINPGRELPCYDPQLYDNSSMMAQNIVLQQKSSVAFEMETQGIIKQLFSRFLAQAVYKNEHIEERILKSLHYIHKNIDQPIDINRLAEICYLTKDHFIRLFKKEMNCTPGRYINQKKIETAQLRILIDKASLKDIAYGLGFGNLSYFNRLFTKIVGENPGKYKKKTQL
ncbi:MAG: AraC family transcriptional regulator [Tannerellaceae bacterium]|jgi:AraC-like DNA-binding protein|nr:AraC family transcriptional regulator [Tannerellaceae bacterium]